MMTASIMMADGIIARINDDTTRRSALLCTAGHKPALALLLVDDDPYALRMLDLKIQQARKLGLETRAVCLPVSSTEPQILAEIAKLNADADIDGIFVQAPLPPHLDAGRIYSALAPHKDVDGYHPLNVGLLVSGGSGFVSCAPLGGMMLLRECLGNMIGRQAVVVGRSALVGKPMALMLLQEGCTVTIAHSKTQALLDSVGRADIVVAAAGIPGCIQGRWIKPGAAVLDFGANRIAGRVVGDVDFDQALLRAGWINRPTGAIGPLTIALLLKHTVDAASLKACNPSRLQALY